MLNDKEDTDTDTTNAQFDEKDNMAIVNIILALDDLILFNVSNLRPLLRKGM